jgi:hypothetical protein
MNTSDTHTHDNTHNPVSIPFTTVSLQSLHVPHSIGNSTITKKYCMVGAHKTNATNTTIQPLKQTQPALHTNHSNQRNQHLTLITKTNATNTTIQPLKRTQLASHTNHSNQRNQHHTLITQTNATNTTH